MKLLTMATLLLACSSAVLACTRSGIDDTTAPPQPGADPDITAFIEKIRVVDNHSHANSTSPGDSDYDALPLETIFPFEIPVQLRPDNANWVAAYKALYKYPHTDMSDAHLKELRATMQSIAREQSDKFPEWVLDQTGTEILLVNRVSMGPGLTPPRFRWVSYVDALMLPLSTRAEAATSPDRKKLFPLEDKLLRRYMSDLNLAKLPASLDAYLKTVVTPTLEAQQKGGCLAVKFEAAFLRSLDFEEVSAAAASQVYAKYADSGEPSHAEYKRLQDFLFRYIAQEAGRLGMAVHIHSFNGPGNFFRAADADPLLLEPVFNDPILRKTNFVIVHGGGVYASHAGAMLWKPNVYLDMSAMTLLYTPAGRDREGLDHPVSREGPLRLRRRRVRAGYGLGSRRLDRHTERKISARVGTHQNDPRCRDQPRPGGGDRDNGNAQECRKALQAGSELRLHQKQMFFRTDVGPIS